MSPRVFFCFMCNSSKHIVCSQSVYTLVCYSYGVFLWGLDFGVLLSCLVYGAEEMKKYIFTLAMYVHPYELEGEKRILIEGELSFLLVKCKTSPFS